jgi:arylsulfatase A-like enzyme
MVNPADIDGLRPANLANKPDYYSLIRQYRKIEDASEGLFSNIRAKYYGCNSYVDLMLGQLLDALDETGLAEDTVVIVSADHGDWAGDYGLVEKWPSALDDPLIRVPLIIRAPGNTAAHVVHEQVELFDIMATVMELAGLEIQHTHFAQSLVPQLMGNTGNPNRAVFAEGGYDPHEPHCFEGRSNARIFTDTNHIYYPKGLQQRERPESVCRATMIRTLEAKMVHRPLGVSELYDLRSDPMELHNVYDSPAYADMQKKMELDLLDWAIHTADVVPLREDARGLPRR